jgi:hypothetical protein
MLEGLPLWEQTIRFKRALASIAEMELDGLKTSLVRRDEMDRVWDCIRLTTQKRMAKVPAEVAPRVFGNESMPAVVAILTKGIDDALEDISRTDPETGAVQYVTGGLNAGE